MPRTAPPTASVTNSRTTSSAPNSSPPTASASNMVKTTTPMPSLNRDSPAILASSGRGTLTVLRMLSTAMGSVGLIRAPNTSAQAKGSGAPRAALRAQTARAIRTVEMRTPALARVVIAHLRRASSERSTCKAPANSRMPSMPSMTTAWKSISRRTPRSASSSANPSTTPSSAIRVSEAASAITTRPIVWGRRRYL